MWPGEINNERIYRAQFANQIEQSAMESNYNVLQPCNAVNTSFHNAVQGGNNSLFSPQAMPCTSFQNNGEIIYQCTNIGQPERVSSQLMMGHRMNNAILFNNCDNIHGIKRKADDDYSPLYCGEKKRITDEHMAAGMNSLYITNDHNYCNNVAMFNSNDIEDIDVQFGSTSDDIQYDIKEEEGKRKEYPVFHFTAPLEQMLRKKNDILPPKVIQEICKPCLAMVPWSPPLHTKSTVRDEGEIDEVEVMTSTQDEMKDDNFVL